MNNLLDSSRGQHLNDQWDLDHPFEAVESLAEAPVSTARARVHYNYGLAFQQAGRIEDADATLREARRRDDRDPDVVLALARLLMDQHRWSEASEFATVLVRLAPTAGSGNAGAGGEGHSGSTQTMTPMTRLLRTHLSTTDRKEPDRNQNPNVLPTWMRSGVSVKSMCGLAGTSDHSVASNAGVGHCNTRAY